MKKLTAILLSVLLLIGICSGCGNTKDFYIGEGKMTVIRSLISTNDFLANEVFGENHLPVDASETLTRDTRTLAPVVSDIFSTYAELENLVYTTYTEDVAKRLLSEPEKYVEIDGKLYFDLHYSVQQKTEYVRRDFETELKKVNDDGSYTFKVKFINPKGLDTTAKMNVTEADGTLRLCDFYN
ncbi:MAG: hypothetical protein IJD78_01740 [Clostridia bacterium]|nr:hypothetical protein [Clostridia bacterium]